MDIETPLKWRTRSGLAANDLRRTNTQTLAGSHLENDAPAMGLHEVTIVAMTAKKTLLAPARQEKTKSDAEATAISVAPEPVMPKRSTRDQPTPKKRAKAAKQATPLDPKPKTKGKATPKVKVAAKAATHTAAKVKRAGPGQPTLYKDEYADIAHNMCAIMGATNKELAEVLGVCESTIDNWIVAHPAFKTALGTGKLIADSNVAAALYKTAVGYEHDDMDIRTISLGMNAGSEIVMTPIIKIVQPNPSSAQWWLKNRRGGDWKDKSEVAVEHTVPNEEEGRARFTDRMAAAAKRQAEVRKTRRKQGMMGD